MARGRRKEWKFSSAEPGGGDFGKRGQGLLFATVESAMVNNVKAQGANVSLRNRSGDESGQRGGSFSQFQADFLRRNAILAQDLAELAVEKLRASYARPRVSRGALERALLDPRNRRVKSTYWGVGDIAFLDRSDAKYWRTIEQGTRHFVGRRISGVWSASIGGGPYYGFRSSRTQDMFMPMSASDALDFLRANGERGSRGGIGKTHGIIKRPIQPHRYLRSAWREFKPRERSKEALIAALIESGVIRR